MEEVSGGIPICCGDDELTCGLKDHEATQECIRCWSSTPRGRTAKDVHAGEVDADAGVVRPEVDERWATQSQS